MSDSATKWTAAYQASLSITNSGVYSNSCPSQQWCHPTISSSVIPFSSHLQSFPTSGSFPMSSLHQVAKVLELQLQHQSFQWIFRIDIFWSWLIWSPCSPRDSQESSPAPQFEGISSSVLSNLYITAGKTIALTIRTFVGKVMPLLFNMLSRFILTFLLKSKHLWSWLEMICWINEGRPKKNGVTLLKLNS